MTYESWPCAKSQVTCVENPCGGNLGGVCGEAGPRGLGCQRFADCTPGVTATRPRGGSYGESLWQTMSQLL
jgi:hypothetical protein